ncbi:MAG: HEAT repeat domain-containing protein [Balneolaceae bacterium]
MMTNEARLFSEKSRNPGYLFLLILFGLTVFSTCSGPSPEPEIVSVSDEESGPFANRAREEAGISLADSLEISLWASERLIADPVALSVDHQGRIWITSTNRRYSSSLDIRNHPEWRTQSLQMTSTDDKREFVRQKLSPEYSEENSGWLADLNDDGLHDWRDLAVESDEVYLLEDISGNGLANRSQLFYRGFNDEIADLAGAITYHNEQVFVGAAPEVRRLKDTNYDGMADQQELLSQGYGVHITFSGHGMSGMVIGPDGRLYWGVGDIGLNVLDQEGNRLEYPFRGSILRMEPDGSGLEVFATGLRNTHEFVFDKYGNLISVDNDGDYPGEYERLVYLTDGSDTGWRIHWQFGKYSDEKNNGYNVWMDENYYHPRFENQAAHLLPPIARYHNGPAGMVYNPGTALGEKWKDHFFVASFVGTPSRSGIDAFTLEPKGASFELASDKEVMRGILATGLDFGPDGALYMADWIEGWATNDEGRIWKLDVPGESGSELRERTGELLKRSFEGEEEDFLFELLGYEDMRVRMKAQFELAARESAGWLEKAIADDGHPLRRIHGIWGLGQLGRRQLSFAEPLVEWLEDEDSEIRAQAARTLGDAGYEPAGEALIRRLEDPHDRVRFFATQALGRLGYSPAVQPIVGMLEDNNDEQVYLRQAGAIALSRIGDTEAVANLASHPSKAVRIAAVVTLRRMEHPEIVRFLRDEDEYVVTNAARAINDDAFIEEALPDLARMLDQDRFVNEPLIRRAINANVFAGLPDGAARLARFAGQEDRPDELREEAIAALSVWPAPSVLDRVNGRYRGSVENDREAARQALESVVQELIADGNPAIRQAVTEAVQRLSYREAEPELIHLLESDPSASVRVAALQTLRDLDSGRMERISAVALNDEEPSVRQTALGMLTRMNLSGEEIVRLVQPVLENGLVSERQSALETLGELNHPDAYRILEDYMDRLMEGEAAPEIELDILEAVQAADSEPLNRRLNRYLDEKPDDDPIAGYREALYGGDAERGRELFREHAGAQCVRCHIVDGSGSDVGPDLTTVGSRLTRRELLESMVDPNARVAPGYGVVTVTLANGESLRGVLKAETPSTLTLQVGDSQQTRTLQKSDLTERTNSPSGMPPLDAVLSKGELRDLVEYLSTLQEDS